MRNLCLRLRVAGAFASSLAISLGTLSFMPPSDRISHFLHLLQPDSTTLSRLSNPTVSKETFAFKQAVNLKELEPPVSRSQTHTATPLAATVSPQSIQLGETLTVRIPVISSEFQPIVSMGDRQYPAFAISSTSSHGPYIYRALIPSSPLDTPGSHTITVQVGEMRQTLPVTLRDRQFPTQSITVHSGGLQATQKEIDAVTNFKAVTTPARHWNGLFLRPSSGRVSSIYGVRRYYNGVFANNYYHRGVDYAAPFGAPIVAPAAGTIALVGLESEGFNIHGNTVGIDHGQGVVSIFLHLNSIDVTEGQAISAGQKIGTIGTSGASTGPHLHWGLYVHTIAVDPVPWRYQGLE